MKYRREEKIGRRLMLVSLHRPKIAEPFSICEPSCEPVLTRKDSLPLDGFFCAQEHFVEWKTVEGDVFRVIFKINETANRVEQNGRCIARGRKKGLSLWGATIYECGRCGQEKRLLATGKLWNPKITYTLEGKQLAKVVSRAWGRDISIEYLDEAAEFLPVMLADVLQSYDPRRASRPPAGY
jgi:hypothetical protein